MRFSPLRFSATVANSFPRSSSKEQTLPLLKKCQTHKTSTCLRRLENEFSRLSPLAGRQSKKWVFLSCQEGGKSVARINSLNSFRFAPVRHLPLTLPVYFSHWPNKKRVAEATLF